MTSVPWLKVPDMSREEWLKWRRSGIGSSDAPAIMGHNPYKTAYKVWQAKVFGEPEFDNYHMQRGRELEPKARQKFIEKMGVSVAPLNTENKANSWQKASLDGISECGKIMVEIKCPYRGLDSEVPAIYIDQCQHQLMVTGLPGMYYFSFDGNDGLIIEVPRNQNYIEKELFPREQEFWNLVLKYTSPELGQQDLDYIKNAEEWSKFFNYGT